MKIIRSVKEMQQFCESQRLKGRRIGFVPTMGYLHEGHLSLVKEAKKRADVVIASVFVNPAQFAPSEDFESYPRDFERDSRMLEEEGTDAIFKPNAADIYTDSFSSYVAVEGISTILEGSTRPTHFRGVTTIVSILFNIVKPHVAVFGQKDAQQITIIKKMVNDLRMDVEIFMAPIIREEDGLAKSSRNIYLMAEERSDSTVLYRSLQHAEGIIKHGERNVATVKKNISDMINSVSTGELDYVEVVDAETFEPVQLFSEGFEYFVLVACRFGRARLIDNALISLK